MRQPSVGQCQGFPLGQGQQGEIIRGVGQLEDARKAYETSLASVAAAKQAAKSRIDTAQAKADQARTALAEAIVAEARSGTRQVDIVRRSGYSRERVRQILREGGIEPD